MIKYLQLPFTFDVQKMQDELLQLGNQLWKLHFQVKHYEGDWSAILLRSINGDVNNGFISPTEDAFYADTILLDECAYFKEILHQFKCPLLSVRLLKLSAGTQIHEHKDADLNFEEGLVRFHIPVITNADVDFYLDKEKMVLQQGECWYMNFNLPHSLHNKSNSDRIHLVIDAEVNDWVKDLFSSPQVTNKKEIAETPKHSKEELQEIILHLRKLNTEVANKMADDMEHQLN
jgi:mannose-6-phosphate isomerase-like protein (cupin superfamily)